MYIRSMKEYDYSTDKRPDNSAPHEFENLVRDCATIAFGQDFHLYGRSGQAQHGIDIFSDDWTILIQCKAYKNHKDFREVMKKEYKDARDHFQKDGQPSFQRFFFATTLDTDAPAQEIARELSEDGIPVRVWFWDDLLKIINNYCIRNDSDTYAKEFEETLFLHKKQRGYENVCLKNLFVPQKYREWGKDKEFDDVMDDLLERIQCFCGDDKDKLLIIEGDAGSGKSTLAAKLCFEERKYSRQILDTVPEAGRPLPTSPSLLAGRPLLTVRLRDLEITGNPEHQLGLSILSHLKIRDKEELKRLFPRAVLLLDGFDELYMKLQTALGKALNCENMLNQLCGWLPRGCKLILTSRPKCVNVNRLSITFSFSEIALQHFSRNKREEWLNQYRKALPKDGDSVDEEVARYILSIDNGSISILCDTPMTLYLLIGSKAKFELTKNEWALYHYIFSEAVVDTPYTEQADGSQPLHPMGPDIGRLLYWITEEIAYQMYRAGEVPGDQSTIQTEDGQFLVTGATVKKIINDLLQNEQFREAADRAGLRDANSFDLQRIHALCCYWRSGSADGPVEFYHNNIRDFFLCEKIRRELNQLYQESGSNEEKTDRIAHRLVSLFKYGEINKTVCRFLGAYAREAVSKQKQKEFPLLEKEHHLLPILFQKLLMKGRLFDSLGMDDHIEAIKSVLLSTGLVYRSVYDPILEEEERIRWWHDVKAVNRSGMVQFIVKNCIGKFASDSDLRLADLRNADLHLTDLRLADLRNADLREAHLSGAVLFRADLSGAHLNGTHLNGAHLNGAHLNGADFRWADLHGADLRYADLHGADLHGADLHEAWLSDGFRTNNQDEQIKHLKSLNIPCLKL